MCGIFASIAARPVADTIFEALKRLEYRGYDSAGIATLFEGEIKRERVEGKLANLEARLGESPLSGTIGIGHTRWATHGRATEQNAHPHISSGIAIVHNGIIENFGELRRELEKDGFAFSSQTDTETVAHLIAREMKKGLSPQKAFFASLKRLRGAFALAALFAGEDDLLLAARNGPPLAIAQGKDEIYLGSDSVALAPLSGAITYLEDGDWAILRRDGFEIMDMCGNRVSRRAFETVGAPVLSGKGNHRHYMIKEIHEQPEMIAHTLSHYLDLAAGKVSPPEKADFAPFERLAITACGTAHYAALVAQYWFGRLAQLPVDADIASEFRYRQSPFAPNTLALFVSQSGETADTLACLKYSKQAGLKTSALVNAPQSSIARESDIVFPTLAGPEIGVASTKAFTCQLAALASLAIIAGVQKGVIDSKQEAELVEQLGKISRFANNLLKKEEHIAQIAQSLAHKEHVLYLGRDVNYPLALEGALKLKETSYIHAEGFGAGELKHGPIALVDEKMPIVVLAPHDRIFAKTVSNMQEVAARGAHIILITDESGDKAVNLEGIERIVMDDMPEIVMPIVSALAVQLLAYHTASFMGTDLDQPRNLAKSVTVE